MEIKAKDILKLKENLIKQYDKKPSCVFSDFQEMILLKIYTALKKPGIKFKGAFGK